MIPSEVYPSSLTCRAIILNFLAQLMSGKGLGNPKGVLQKGCFLSRFRGFLWKCAFCGDSFVLFWHCELFAASSVVMQRELAATAKGRDLSQKDSSR